MTEEKQIIEFIDRWLEENAWNADSRVQDFALDVRLMLSQIDRGGHQDLLEKQAP